MSSRKKTRQNQTRQKLLAELWKQLEAPGLDPETAIRLTKQIAKLELPGATLSAADKAEAKDAAGAAGKLPKTWLLPDAEGVRWAIVYAVERLARLPVPHPTALDAWIASLSPEEQAGLRASAAKLGEPGTPVKPVAIAPQPTTPIVPKPFTEADALRHFHGG